MPANEFDALAVLDPPNSPEVFGVAAAAPKDDEKSPTGATGAVADVAGAGDVKGGSC